MWIKCSTWHHFDYFTLQRICVENSVYCIRQRFFFLFLHFRFRSHFRNIHFCYCQDGYVPIVVCPCFSSSCTRANTKFKIYAKSECKAKIKNTGQSEESRWEMKIVFAFVGEIAPIFFTLCFDSSLIFPIDICSLFVKRFCVFLFTFLHFFFIASACLFVLKLFAYYFRYAALYRNY